jgi:hypothetical protein
MLLCRISGTRRINCGAAAVAQNPRCDTPDLKKIPLAIVDQHVDAVRAIVREYTRADIVAVAANLTGKLRTVTDEFLMAENQHRPEILKVLASPSLVPGETF